MIEYVALVLSLLGLGVGSLALARQIRPSFGAGLVKAMSEPGKPDLLRDVERIIVQLRNENAALQGQVQDLNDRLSSARAEIDTLQRRLKGDTAAAKPASSRPVRASGADPAADRLMAFWQQMETRSGSPQDYRRWLQEQGVAAYVMRGDRLERLADDLATSSIVDFLAIPDPESGLTGLVVGPRLTSIRETIAADEDLKRQLSGYFQLSEDERIFRLIQPALMRSDGAGLRLDRRGQLSI